MAAAPLAKGRGQCVRADSGVLGGRSSMDWSTFRERGREILSKARDRESCVRLMKAKAMAFINSIPNQMDFEEGREGLDPAALGGRDSTLDSATRIEDQGNKGEVLQSVSFGLTPNSIQGGNGKQVMSNIEIKFVDSSAKFGEENLYFRRGISVAHYHPVPSALLAPASVSVSVCQESAMEVNGSDGGMGASPSTPAAAAVALAAAGSDGHGAPSLVRAEGAGSLGGAPGLSDQAKVYTPRQVHVVQGAGVGAGDQTPATAAPSLPLGRAAVGGPSGLALTVTPSAASIGFTSAAAGPPPLRRAGKSKQKAVPWAGCKPVVIDMEAALRAVAGKLAVARVLSPYPTDPKAVFGDLHVPWKLRGNAVAQKVESSDGRFVITFLEEGDLKHILRAGPWHFRNNAVLIAELDGKDDPVDVCLDSFMVWVQIHGLPVPLKTKAMGRVLGEQLGEVKAVAHQNEQIVDEYIRVCVIHKVEEPLRKFVVITPLGSTEEIRFNVKYEKLPNFCLCCGMVGHMTAKFCCILAEQRKADYSIDLKAPVWGGSVRRHLDLWGLPGTREDDGLIENIKLPDKVITVVATAVQKLSVAASPLIQATDRPGEKAASSMATDPGLQVLGFSQEGRPVLVGSGSRGLEITSKIDSAVDGAEDSAAQAAQPGLGVALNTNSGAALGQAPGDGTHSPGEHLSFALGAPGASVEEREMARMRASVQEKVQPAKVVLAPLDGSTGAKQTHLGELQAGPNNPTGAMGLSKKGFVEGLKAHAHGGQRPSVDAKGDETILGRWKRVHREEREERDVVQYAGVKHAMFGVPTPPNSGSELSQRGAAFVCILESFVLSKRRCPDDQDFIINMKCSSESIELPSCKRVCGERVEAVVGIDGLVTHVTKEVDGGEEVNQEKKEGICRRGESGR